MSRADIAILFLSGVLSGVAVTGFTAPWPRPLNMTELRYTERYCDGTQVLLVESTVRLIPLGEHLVVECRDGTRHRVGVDPIPSPQRRTFR